MCPVVTHIISNEGSHCHGVTTNYADSSCCRSGSLGSHDGANERAVLPACGLVYKGSGLSSASAEYDSGYGNTCGIVEFLRKARTVDSGSGETAVGVCSAGRLVSLVILSVIPNVTLPVDSVCGGILVKSFPPNGVVVEVMNNIGEYGVSLGGVKSVGVGALVGTGSNAEEAILGVYCPKSAVLSDTEPCNIVTYAPYLVALLLKEFGRERLL